MRQRRWMEFLKDYDCTIHYHPGQANVVADALSRRDMTVAAGLMIREWQLIEMFSGLTVSVVPGNGSSMIAMEIRQVNVEDQRLHQWVDENGQPIKKGFKYRDGILKMNGRIYVPNHEKLRKKILDEAYRSKYTIHPRATKMYKDLREIYWWPGMEHSVARYVA